MTTPTGALRRASLLCLLVLSAGTLAAQTTYKPDTLALDDVRYLSADSMGGRLVGTPGADSAAAFIARRFKQSGLQASPVGWFQEFVVAKDAAAAQSAGIGGAVTRNVIGVLPGRDPKLRNEIVIVGAHYDHLGLGKFGSLDPDSTGAVHNGADDNASGVAALFRIADTLAVMPPARTVVIIAFSGEEEGVLGSSWYVQHPVFPMAAVTAMINLDMVGRLRNDRLIVYGVQTAKQFPALLDSLNATAKFDLKASGDGYGPSDHQSFYLAGKPVLHIFTDLHEDYHRSTDDWQKINADGLVRVADFAAAIVQAIGDRRTPLTFVNAPPPQPHAGAAPAATPGYGAYLGTIPDMSGGSEGGVRLSGVRPGSPAEAAGLKTDDVLVAIGGMKTPDLQAMTDALRSHKAGDTVDLQVLRDGKPVTLTATLGTRNN
jgi:peptidase M28-like protein/PDZ domain-containing protein